MSWDLEIENVAGIRSGTARVEPGVNAVSGSNWRGKSSLVAAIETAMGTAKPLTEGEPTGRVSLTTDERTITTELRRTNGEDVVEGETYLVDEMDRVSADLFAFLSEDNEIRRAVRNGDNLEALLTRPLDFENIDEKIVDLNRERDAVETELERAEEAARDLPDVERAISSLESELDELRKQRDEIEGSQSGGDDDRRDELSDLRAERDRLEDRVERLERTIQRTEERLEKRRDELQQLEVPDSSDIESKLADAREDLRSVERDVELLQSVYEANKRVLDEGRLSLLSSVEHGIDDDAFECWICAQEADRTVAERQLADLHERIDTLEQRATDARERVDQLQNERDEIQQSRKRERDLKNEIADLETTLSERKESLQTAEDRLAELTGEIDDLSQTVEDVDSQLTDVESEIKYTKAELEDRRDEREQLEQRSSQLDTLEEEYESLTAEIQELRTRKERVKREARESFDEVIREVVDRFDTGFETARLTPTFDLVVAREGREANLDALSEGELELLGIVAALAGYEAYDVNERVPIMLLDRVGGLASDNLAELVTFLSSRTEYLVLTTYPDQHDFEGHVLDPEQWTVVSDGPDVEVSS